MYVNQFIYSRERRRFGRQCLFSDRTQLMLSVTPSLRRRLQYILRNPVTRSTQLSDQKAFSVMETENVTHTEHGMYHYEGGWPREININDEEQTIRHRKKIEREDYWGPQVSALCYGALEVVQQNSAVNIYEDFFADLSTELGCDIRLPFESRPQNNYHDPIKPGRSVSVIDFMPSNIRAFLAVHTAVVPKAHNIDATKKSPLQVHGTGEIQEIESAIGSENSFYVWDIKDPLKPMFVFDCSEILQKAFFCPKDENLIAGGFQPGGVAIWDIREGTWPIRSCPLEASHREPVSSLCWVHSKTNSEFYSGSFDGSIKYWDGRDLRWYVHELLLDPETSDTQLRKRSHGVTVLEFEYTIPVRYIIGSDMGHIFVGNRKGTTPAETLVSNYKIVSGPIRTIERNPFFVKNFLVVGDWCAKVWAEECKSSPTTLLVKKKNQLMCGSWSTARCSLFVTGDEKGYLDFWDLLLSHRTPIFSFKFKWPITCVKFRPDGHSVVVAFENGDVHIMELDQAMKQSGSKDKALIAALFERETQRCKLLEGRVEESKLKRNLANESANLMSEANDTTTLQLLQNLDPDDPEQLVQMIESDTEYKDALRFFRDLIFNLEKKRQERQHIMERTDFEIDIQPSSFEQSPIVD